MTWGLAQAGNRAGKTGRYLQWWENEPEQDAVTSVPQNLHDSICFFLDPASPSPPDPAALHSLWIFTAMPDQPSPHYILLGLASFPDPFPAHTGASPKAMQCILDVSRLCQPCTLYCTRHFGRAVKASAC